ncbi:MAG: TIGR03936 family radical SAM-associated protein [Oscillospiraceae bacterium]|nr:TIGR03936 family radical SAM-associated protein [Oscillospiraceae bacterium]
MIPVRATFEKRRRAKYISHLDLMRCMQRAFKRAGVPIWYTEGFNPHAYLMFPLALSLGYESGCECMDFRIDGDMSMQEAMERMNRVLPPDLQIVRVAEPVRKHTDIAFADYTVMLECADDTVPAEALRAAWDAFIAQPEILVEKKTKRGSAQVDVKAQAQILSAETSGNGLLLKLRMPAGTAVNVNPGLLTDAFTAALEQQHPEIRTGMLRAERTAIFCADGTPFA